MIEQNVYIEFCSSVVSMKRSHSSDDEGGLVVDSEDVEVLEIAVVVWGAQWGENWPVGCIQCVEPGERSLAKIMVAMTCNCLGCYKRLPFK